LLIISVNTNKITTQKYNNKPDLNSSFAIYTVFEFLYAPDATWQ